MILFTTFSPLELPPYKKYYPPPLYFSSWENFVDGIVYQDEFDEDFILFLFVLNKSRKNNKKSRQPN